MMKLFVWKEPYGVSWGQSAFFAVAETVEQAREMAKSAPLYSYFSATPDKEEPPRDIQLGEPDRVVDLPCAEFHQWCE